VIRPLGMLRHLSYALGVSCFIAGLCCAAEIKVRVINAKDGQPVKGVPLWLSPGESSSTNRLLGTTGPDGVATFHVFDPPPKSIFEYEEVSGKIGGCSSGTFSTREVIERGVVGDTKYRRCDPAGKLKGKFTATHGEVIVFVRFLKWWEKMQM
jgi:hypothetical protein